MFLRLLLLAFCFLAVVRDPANGEWQIGLANARFYAGEALRTQGDLTGAMREYQAYRDIAQRLVDREPQTNAGFSSRRTGWVELHSSTRHRVISRAPGESRNRRSKSR